MQYIYNITKNCLNFKYHMQHVHGLDIGLISFIDQNRPKCRYTTLCNSLAHNSTSYTRLGLSTTATGNA